MRYKGHIVHFGSSVVQNVIALFFLLGWVGSGSHKKCARTSYIELVFLHVVRSTAHIVRLVVSRA
jgi:hypothetical protein